jgi:hypothetical protein
MARKLSEELKDGDKVSIALRGGAGWVRGTVVWIREEQMLIKHADPALGDEVPYVLIDLSQITGLALPREIEPVTNTAKLPGFLR